MKAERDAMMFSQRGTSSSKANRQRIDERINELIRMRKQKLQKTYTRPVIQPPTISVAVPRPKLDTQPRSDVAQMNTERNKITLKMTPVWFETDNQQVALKGIVYPSNTTDHRPFNTVARYRIMIGQSNDFCKQALAVDYRKAGLPESEQRGGYPYYSPIGWYCHALKVDQKYPNDNVWFGSVNAKGEWPVAFHGTHSSTVSGVIEQDFLKSTTQTNVASQETMDQSGFYLTTHCNGGAHPHCTTPFRLEMPDKKNKTFRVVFMCRVQPDKFTIHQAPALAGHIWRLVDSDAVRPYGILIKDEDARNN
ncbi:unnamed protein product [Rotaria sp. Silwood1]|nr:unnamed protein product [Rotaria sp. Silwood1]CAF4866237.1 unnamed protein product [Rotaria sp. Silwood1]